MAHIYFVETRANEQRSLLCRWVECLYEAGRRIQVIADSTISAQHLDQLLWTFSQASFVPHRIHTKDASEEDLEPVVITVGEVRLDGFEILICDGQVGLEFMLLYPIALHFVLQDDDEKRQESRLLWQKARGEGVELHHMPYASAAKPLCL